MGDDEDSSVNDEDLLELGVRQPTESANDVSIGKMLTDSQTEELRQIISKYNEIFTDVPGTTTLAEHTIPLTTDEPVRCKPYPIPYTVRESLKKDVQDMLDMNVIRPSTSAYASPTVIVRKKDGSNRICVDYRKLNKISTFDPEPMVTSEDLFQRCGEDKYFSRIDLSKGYWQFPVAERDIHKTAFVTPDGHYEFLRNPFGMVNSMQTLMRGLRKLLNGMEHCDNYVDDILVHTPDWEGHLKVLEDLFQRMAAAHITARPSKCLLGTDDIDFLGHNLKRGQIGLHEDNIKKISEATRPRSKKEVRSFLGLTGYYRNFIPNYAAIAIPLTDLTKKGQPNTVVWDDSCEKAFSTLKTMLTNKPILWLADMKRPFILRTDASNIGLGAMLLQEREGEVHPVAYASKKLSETERKYATIEKECLAIVWGIKKFTNYLYGREFVIQTDHKPLTYLNNKKFINDKIMRWALFLQGWRFTIMSIKGKDNVGADFLSRNISMG